MMVVVTNHLLGEIGWLIKIVSNLKLVYCPSGLFAALIRRSIFIDMQSVDNTYSV